MGGTDTKRRLDGFTDAAPSAAPDALSDGLSDGLVDSLGGAATPDVGQDVARTERQLSKVVGTPGKGPTVGETSLDAIVDEATADHAAGLG